MANNIVEEWLRSLNLVHYTQAFIDNGYDDLEICKQIGEPDLDAIGVLKPSHRKEILNAVTTLKEEGGTAVYFTLEESALHQNGYEDYVSREKIQIYTDQPPPQSPVLDEYEEGRRALITYPRLQLKRMLKERLAKNNINLLEPPYTITVSAV